MQEIFMKNYSEKDINSDTVLYSSRDLPNRVKRVKNNDEIKALIKVAIDREKEVSELFREQDKSLTLAGYTKHKHIAAVTDLRFLPSAKKIELLRQQETIDRLNILLALLRAMRGGDKSQILKEKESVLNQLEFAIREKESISRQYERIEYHLTHPESLLLD